MSDTDVIISPAGLLDVKNAARYLGVSIHTVRWLRRTFQLKAAMVGNKLMFRQSDLDEYITRQFAVETDT